MKRRKRHNVSTVILQNAQTNNTWENVHDNHGMLVQQDLVGRATHCALERRAVRHVPHRVRRSAAAAPVRQLGLLHGLRHCHDLALVELRLQLARHLFVARGVILHPHTPSASPQVPTSFSHKETPPGCWSGPPSPSGAAGTWACRRPESPSRLGSLLFVLFSSAVFLFSHSGLSPDSDFLRLRVTANQRSVASFQSNWTRGLIMGLLELLGQVERLGVGVALVAAVLGALYVWQQAVGDVGVTKMLRDFNLVRVLKRTDSELALLGNFKSDNHKKPAVLVIQTAAMDSGTLDRLLAGMSLHEILVNDIYSTFQGDVARDVKPYKVNLIYPATERHVRKHTDQNFHMVVETKEAYRMITKPYIDSIPPENIEWVYNILEQ
ncbi:unnamed protein product [Phytophthora fragariaefolia]|uniref:Unnamed protein product n=1 Tax=Phytophthora fragariaefolia TaxID=1490495 RepID=A0A9W6XSX6_9STRA|nr:unnamed protein product [Phytophthora fragariaefolia]